MSNTAIHPVFLAALSAFAPAQIYPCRECGDKLVRNPNGQCRFCHQTLDSRAAAAPTRVPAPVSNVRVDYAPRPRWMKRLRAGPMAIRNVPPRALGRWA